MFEFVAGLCSPRKAAWDCGTGNGQCAVSLARYFGSVIATDASEKQLAHAEAHPRVEYRLATAEQSELPGQSFDLVTVAQALHWFKVEPFWDEVRRVLRPQGVIAAWCYSFVQIAPEIDAVVNRYYGETVGPYWNFERKLVEDGYRGVSFPFPETTPPAFAIEASWSLEHLVGYLRSWSATQNFIAANHFDPVDGATEELATVWGDPDQQRPVRWPLHMRVGRNAVAA